MSRIALNFAAFRRSLGAKRRGFLRPFACFRAGFGPTPDGLTHRPEPLWPGDAVRGRAMVGGRWMFDGETAEGPRAPWFVAAPSENWTEALHGFEWLEHLAAIGDREAKRAAQSAALHWIAQHGGGSGSLAWRPHVTGRRLIAWLTHSDLILDGADDRARKLVLRAMARQGRFLRRRWRSAPRGAKRLSAITGLVYAGLCIDGFERGFLNALEDLAGELGGQLSPDGGHFSRCPSELFEVFALAVALRRDLDSAGGAPTKALTLGIEAMAPMIRTLRLGDGGLALFNSGRELADGRVDYALAEARASAPAHSLARDSGFGRLASGRTIAVMDARAPGPRGFSTRATAGLLAFEASAGGQRLIVSCGPGEHLGPEWAKAGRATAAHSTLTLGETSCLEFLDVDSYAGGWLGARALMPYPAVKIERVEDLAGVWLTATHDAYLRRFGVVHARRLFLSLDGGELTGQDLLSPPEGHTARGPDGAEFAVRFHLHPDVDAALVGEAVTLRSPGGPGWTLRQQGGAATLEDSVYLGGPKRKPRASKQVVVRGRLTDYQGVVNWAFRRSDSTAPAQRDTSRGAAEEQS